MTTTSLLVRKLLLSALLACVACPASAQSLTGRVVGVTDGDTVIGGTLVGGAAAFAAFIVA